MEPLLILLALGGGLLCKRAGYPPLPGYLFAGFVAHGVGLGDIGIIERIAEIGLHLLLFTIGLKLNARELAAPQVWGVAGLQMLVAVPLTTLVILLAAAVLPEMMIGGAGAAWTLALALSFSSTVLAVKVFEERGEAGSFHARLAIGVLVIQDVIAVAYLAAASGKPPSALAPGLLALALARPALIALLRLARHGELVLLFGFALALGGAALFELVDLKGGLGALMLGMILAGTPQAKELYNSLAGLKDLFLVGFFLQIGYYGLPTGTMWLAALALSALILLRPAIYFLLFAAFKLRARTALLSAASLFSYSEFGLVVAAAAVGNGLLSPQWLTTIALAVSLSFFLATPFNLRIHALYSRWGERFQRLERSRRIPAETHAEAPAALRDADVAVLGMGRVGLGAFEILAGRKQLRVAGIEENAQRVAECRAAGHHCVRGDATDYDFWAHTGLKERPLILVCLANHQENLSVVELAREVGFPGQLAVVSRYPDQLAELEALGCIAFNLYGEAGHGFAEHVLKEAGLES